MPNFSPLGETVWSPTPDINAHTLTQRETFIIQIIYERNWNLLLFVDVVVPSENKIDFSHIFCQPDIVGGSHVSESNDAMAALPLELPGKHGSGLDVVSEGDLFRVDRRQGIQPLSFNEPNLLVK